MISKRIDRSGKTSDFARLGRYVLEAKDNHADILWTRTAEYVVDLQGGEKVLWSRLSNCEAEIPILAIAEIEATQAQNTRSKADKTYHCVISFPEGEIPTREQLEDIEDSMCEALGFGKHQRISAVHKDTDNIHLHVAINKVHPTTLKVLEPYRDYYIRDKACRALEQKYGLLVDNGMGQGQRLYRAGDLEAHQGEESLLSWIKAQVGNRLKQISTQGQDWRVLHAVLAEYNLVIKPRGNGLVIGTQDGSLHVKASSVDRGLSFKTLTDRLGPYQPPRQQGHEQPQTKKEGLSSSEGKNYQRGPRQGQHGGGSLWVQYQAERERMGQERAIALNRLKQEQEQARRQVLDELTLKRASIKANAKLTTKTKGGLYKQISAERTERLSQIKAQGTQQREAIWQQYPRAGWDDWLTGQASQGNVEALGVLRGRQQVRRRLAVALLTVETLDEAKTLIHAHLKPTVRRNGDVLYRLKDGGRVEDSVQSIHVPEVTEAATLLALTLADERFQGKALTVEGTNEFKVKVAEMAAIQGLIVRFAAPELEQMRERIAKAREAQQQKLAQLQKQSQERDNGQSRLK
jgi:hypothetical protein